MSSDAWNRRLSRTPCNFVFRSVKRGMGMRPRRRNAWFEDFDRKSRSMFARLKRRGWAHQLPVIADIMVLSDESITPSNVALGGIFS